MKGKWFVTRCVWIFIPVSWYLFIAAVNTGNEDEYSEIEASLTRESRNRNIAPDKEGSFQVFVLDDVAKPLALRKKRKAFMVSNNYEKTRLISGNDAVDSDSIRIHKSLLNQMGQFKHQIFRSPRRLKLGGGKCRCGKGKSKSRRRLIVIRSGGFGGGSTIIRRCKCKKKKKKPEIEPPDPTTAAPTTVKTTTASDSEYDSYEDEDSTKKPNKKMTTKPPPPTSTPAPPPPPPPTTKAPEKPVLWPTGTWAWVPGYPRPPVYVGGPYPGPPWPRPRRSHHHHPGIYYGVSAGGLPVYNVP